MIKMKVAMLGICFLGQCLISQARTIELYEPCPLHQRLSAKHYRQTDPIISCPAEYKGIAELQIVQKALLIARYIASQAYRQADQSPEPIYSTIFKTPEAQQDIIWRFFRASSLPVLPYGPLSIFCINTPEQAYEIGPKVWEHCQRYGGVIRMFPTTIKTTENPFVVICPTFFIQRDEDLKPDPGKCLGVKDNVFSGAYDIVTKPILLFTAMLEIFNPDLVMSATPPNEILKWTAAEAAKQAVSYMLYAICTLPIPLISKSQVTKLTRPSL